MIKISELLKSPGLNEYWGIVEDDDSTKKTNLGKLEKDVLRGVHGCGIEDWTETKNYSSGDYVYYNGQSYKFTSPHAGPWNGTDVIQTTALSELLELKEPDDKETVILHCNISGASVEIADEIYTADEETGTITLVFGKGQEYWIKPQEVTGYVTPRNIKVKNPDLSIRELWLTWTETTSTPQDCTVTVNVSGSDTEGVIISIFSTTSYNFWWTTVTGGVATLVIPQGTTGIIIYPLISGHTTPQTEQVSAGGSTLTYNVSY